MYHGNSNYMSNVVWPFQLPIRICLITRLSRCHMQKYTYSIESLVLPLLVLWSRHLSFQMYFDFFAHSLSPPVFFSLQDKLAHHISISFLQPIIRVKQSIIKRQKMLCQPGKQKTACLCPTPCLLLNLQ